ncbi:uncharacterized protein PHACADRAFT_207133 [Phanerochaete carnosa HHB-10118-sp]|uniref:F-box domain-containing protein n=1 Tax=Phanerochaete carnosa (strain HHB-10118-sp) TaxID=650164 RepID=K5WGV8_PHACS|nr:uncharacterized protein PHACADRAFT_207133 [Phanerochaete carnosa HHB-10118-sp]EKM58299.1 hypothetical protein PHACADRAFT_207133 [Phanerochaete carnosa HHB-10118-sp]
MVPFPSELRDLIIDCLRNDTAALRTCGLTSKAWLPRVRHHLFRFVEVHPGRRGDAFKVLLQDSPDIGRYIRELEISGVGDETVVPEVSGRWPTLVQRAAPATRKEHVHRADVWLEHILPASPTVLSRVISLRLFSLPITPHFAALLGAHFGEVTAVNLDACRSETFGDLLTLPRALTKVGHLRMDGVKWFRPLYHKPEGNIVLRPCSLKSLVLTGKIDATTVISWLVDQERYTSLTSLSCYLSSDASAIAVQKLLEAAGPTLHQLTIGFSEVRDPSVVLKNAELSLQPLTSLRKLHVQCVNATRFWAIPSLSWILILISKANSRYLTELTFSISAADLKDKLNLEGLSVILSNRRYSALRDLIFEVEGHGDQWDDIRVRLNMRLSVLDTKGIQIHLYPFGEHA